jgi:hypothetical protein
MPLQDREYVSSVTLILLGDLDPDSVSAELRLSPSQCWRKGERTVRLADGTVRLREAAHADGGWKLFIAAEHSEGPLEEQLEFWISALQPRITALKRLRLTGFECVLDVFVTSSETASIVLSNRVQKEIAALGLDIRLSFSASGDT